MLIVDDSPYNLLVLKELLKTISKVSSVSTALNGELALEAMLREPFDCVFMDLHMPVMDGYEATNRLRKLEAQGEMVLSNTKLIAFSAITEG